VLFDLTANTHLTVAGSHSGRLNLEVVDTHQTLYATGVSTVYRLSPAGEAAQLVDLSGGATEYELGRYHLALAPDGRLLVSDAKLNIIETMTREGAVTVFAGASGQAGSKDGIALRARFNSPRGLAVGRDGSVFVADAGNHTIRRIDPNGKVSTVAGKTGKRATLDGRRAAARLDSPDSIAIDSTGVLYVTNGTDNLIRKILPTGVVSTINVQPTSLPIKK
jgi:sugar lactone lactonase YvrE